MARRKSRIKLEVPQPPSVEPISVWAALNEPIAYPTAEFTKTFFPVAIFLFLSILTIPYFNNLSEKGYRYGSVAGATIESSQPAEAINVSTPQWYEDLKSAGASLGQFYHETVAVPFGQAATDLLDVSEPVSGAIEFVQPGVSAVKDEWLYLMQDPY